MPRVLVSLGCALAVGGCSGWLPNFDAGGHIAELRVASEPPGAEARVSGGQSCRTPCAMTVVTRGDFSVTFTLPGFLPQSVPVSVRLPSDPRADPDAAVSVQFVPNPVEVALEPAPPPVADKKKPARRRVAPPKPASPT